MAPIVGTSTDPGTAGVTGESSKFNGVLGVTSADGHAGVAGVCDIGNGNGVYGRSKSANGVVGVTSADGHAGVAGVCEIGDGVGIYGKGGRLAGHFEGNVEIDGSLKVGYVSIFALAQQVQELKDSIRNLEEIQIKKINERLDDLEKNR